MSRPFSYNDENYTVIGNLLFCHFHIIAPIKKDAHIAEIPPEIYKRLMFFSNNLIGEYEGATFRGQVVIGCKVSHDVRNYWIDAFSNFNDEGKLHLWTVYQLKDI